MKQLILPRDQSYIDRIHFKNAVFCVFFSACLRIYCVYSPLGDGAVCNVIKFVFVLKLIRDRVSLGSIDDFRWRFSCLLNFPRWKIKGSRCADFNKWKLMEITFRPVERTSVFHVFVIDVFRIYTTLLLNLFLISHLHFYL